MEDPNADRTPPTGTLKVIQYTRDNYSTLKDTEVAIAGTYQGDNTVGNRNVIVQITAADDSSGRKREEESTVPTLPDVRRLLWGAAGYWTEGGGER